MIATAVILIGFFQAPAAVGSAAPCTTMTVQPGNSAQCTAVVTSLNGFSGTVTLSVIGLPTGLTASFNPPQVYLTSGGSASSVLTVSVTSSAVSGSYQVYVEGTSSNKAVTTLVPLQIVVEAQLEPVTFTETGLPAGTSWTISIDGVAQTPSTSSSQTIQVPEGTHTWSASTVTVSACPYSPAPPSNTISVSTTNPTVAINYTGSCSVTITETGLPAGTSWTAAIAGQVKSSTTPSIAFSNVPPGEQTWSAYTASTSSCSYAVPANGYTNNPMNVPTQSTGSAAFSLGCNVTFETSGMGSDASGTLLSVDGTAYTTGQMWNSTAQLYKITFVWTSGSSHTFQWYSPVPVNSTVQYVWQSTSGLATTESGTIVASGAGTVTATYGTQYYLTVNGGNLAGAYGQGWYNKGAQATFGVQNSTAGSNNDKWQFQSWTGTGAGSYTGPKNPATVTMNGPVTETANSVDTVPVDFFIFCTYQGYACPSINGNSLTVGDVQYPQYDKSYALWSQFFVTVYLPVGSTVTWQWNNVQTSDTKATYNGAYPGLGDFGNSQSGSATVVNMAPQGTYMYTSAEYLIYYQVTFQVSPSGAGTISPSGPQWYMWNGNGATSATNFYADTTAGSGYLLTSWSSTGGASITSSNNYGTSGNAQGTVTGPGTVTANYEQFTISLSADNTSPSSGQQVTLTATISGQVSGFYINIFQVNSGGSYTQLSSIATYVCHGGGRRGDRTCSYNTQLSVPFTPSLGGGTYTFVATLGSSGQQPNQSPVATSNQLSITWPAVLISLSASTTTPGAVNYVQLTATLEQPNGQPYSSAAGDYINIWDVTNNNFVGSCQYDSYPSYTVSCQVTAYNYAETGSITYEAFLDASSGLGASNQITHSNQVTVTWPDQIIFQSSGYTLGHCRRGDCTDGVSQYSVVLTVDGTTYTAYQVYYGQVVFMWNPGTTHTFSWTSPLASSASGMQYAWTSTTGLASGQSGSITVTQSGTVTGNYAVQYQLTIAVSPSGAGATSPAAGTYWESYGTQVQLSIASTANGYAFAYWSGNQYSSSGSFPVTIYGPTTETAYFGSQVTFSATGLGADATGNVLYVNTNGYYTAGQLPVTVTVPPGSSVYFSWLNVASTVSGKQYAWQSTSGLSTAQSGYVSSAGNVVASYATQYYLTVNSGYGTTSGSGWYNAGSSANFGVSPASVSCGTGCQYAFTGWSGSGTISYTGSSASSSVTMDSPITETASWQLQYLLTMQVSPSGSGTTSPTVGQYWENGNAQVSISESPASGYYFVNWSGSGSGSYSGSSGSATVTMYAAITETANFAQPQITFQASGIGGDAQGTVLTVDGTAYTIGQLPQTFTWGVGSSHTYSWASPVSAGSGKQYVWTSTSGLVSGQSGTITVSASGTVTGNYATQYQLTIAVNPSDAGTTSPAAGTYWENYGAVVQLSTSPTSSNYQFWYWGGTSGTVYSSSFSVTIYGPTTETAYYQVKITFQATGLGGDAYGNIMCSNYYCWLPVSMLPYSFFVNPGATVTFNWANPASSVPGKEYIWQSTSGLASGQSGSFTVTDAGTLTASYTTDYYLTVSSTYDSPQGSGWYPAGSTAQFSVTSPVSCGTGCQYMFTSWSGSGSGSYTGTSNPGSVVMNAPITETASWQLQYQLTMVTSGSFNGRFIFTGTSDWQTVSYSGNSPSSETGYVTEGSGAPGFSWGYSPGSLSMNQQYGGSMQTLQSVVEFYMPPGSSTLTVTLYHGCAGYSSLEIDAMNGGSWQQITTLTDGGGCWGSGTDPQTWNVNIGAIYSGSSGGTGRGTTNPALGTYWENAGTSIQISAIPDSGYVFTGWSGSGSGSYSGTNNPATITMNGAITETAGFATPQVTFTTSGISSDAQGTVLTVDGTGYSIGQLPTTFNWLVGSSHSYSWSSPISGGSGKQYAWQSTSGLVSGQSGTITVSASGTVTGNYIAQYQLTMAVSPSGAGTTSPAVGTYWENYGATITISASPANSNYQFSSWTGTYGSGSSSFPITITGPTTETADFNVLVTFSQTGIGSDVNGYNVLYSYTPQYGWRWWTVGSLPFSTYAAPGSTMYECWYNINTGSEQYTWQSTSGLTTSQCTYFYPSDAGSVVGHYTTQYYLTVSSSYDNPQGSGWYAAGSTAQFSVTTPVSCGGGCQYVFTSWSGSGSGSYSGTNNPGSVVMNAPITETANWQVQYLLTMQASPSNEGGTSPAVGTYWENGGATVPISASPASGYIFLNWGGSYGSGSYGGGSNPATVTMNGPVTEIANFGTPTITFQGSGYSYYHCSGGRWNRECYDGVPSGNTALTVDGTAYTAYQVYYGITFQWTVGSTHSYSWASPLASTDGSQYAWQSTSGLVSGQSGTLTADASGSVVGHYVDQWPLTIATSPSGGGSTSPAPGTYWENYGSSVQLSASANSGYVFQYWSGSSGTVYSSSTSVTIYGPTYETAYFQMQVTFSQTGIGSDASGQYVLTTWTPTYGWRSWTVSQLPFSDVVSPGQSVYYCWSNINMGSEQYTWQSTSGVGGGSQCPGWTTPSGAGYITGNYAQQFYLTVSSSYGSPYGSGWYNAGTAVSFGVSSTSVSCGTGCQYVFSGWSGSGSVSYSGSSGSATVTMESAITETAGWQLQYLLTVALSPSGAGSSSPAAGQYWENYGASVTLSASAGSGYTFMNWSGTTYSSSASFSITMNQAYTETASFGFQVTFSATGIGPGASGYNVLYSYTPQYGWRWWTAGSLPFSTSVSPGTQIYVCWYNVNTGTEQDNWQSTSGLTGSQCTYLNVNQPGSITGNYQALYYLTVSSSYGSPTGSGWYNAGATASFGISPTTVSCGGGCQFVFSGWSGSGSGSYSGGSNPGSVVMNNAITETVQWQLQYQLTIATSPNGAATTSPAVGTYWENYGSSVPISIVSTNAGYVFQYWTGSYYYGSQSASVPIYGPTTETAYFNTQLILSETGVGSDASGYNILYSYTPTYGWRWWTASQLPITTSISPGQSVYYCWYNVQPSGSVMYTWQSTTGVGGSAQCPGWVTPSGAGYITGNYARQFYLTISSSYDSPYPSSGWYNAGSQVSFGLSSTSVQSGSYEYVFTSWSGSGSGSYTGSSNPATLTMNGAVTETANWQTYARVTFYTSNVGNDATADLSVDGTQYTVTDSSPLTLYFAYGSQHSYSYYSPVSAGAGKQYVFSYMGGYCGSQSCTFNAYPGYYYTGVYNTQYQVTFQATGGGSVSPSGTGWYNYGQSVYMTATAAGGYVFTSWTSSTSSISFSSSQSATSYAYIYGTGTVTGNFAVPTISLSASPSSPGDGGNVLFTATTNAYLTPPYYIYVYNPSGGAICGNTYTSSCQVYSSQATGTFTYTAAIVNVNTGATVVSTTLSVTWATTVSVSVSTTSPGSNQQISITATTNGLTSSVVNGYNPYIAIWYQPPGGSWTFSGYGCAAWATTSCTGYLREFAGSYNIMAVVEEAWVNPTSGLPTVLATSSVVTVTWPAPSFTLTASTTSPSNGQQVTFTVSLDVPLYTANYYINFYRESGSVYTLVSYCYAYYQTTCYFYDTQQLGSYTYIATLGNYNQNPNQGPQLDSNAVTVTWPNTLTLSASTTSPSSGQTITLTAALQYTTQCCYYVNIFEETSPGQYSFLTYFGSWYQTSGSVSVSNPFGSHTYVATFGSYDQTPSNGGYASNTVVVTWPTPTLTLSASTTSPSSNQQVTITVQSSAYIQCSGTCYYINIFERSSGSGSWTLLNVCTYTYTCYAYPSKFGGTYNYIATIGTYGQTPGSGEIVDSNQVTVTWPPFTMNISASPTNPGHWQYVLFTVSTSGYGPVPYYLTVWVQAPGTSYWQWTGYECGSWYTTSCTAYYNEFYGPGTYTFVAALSYCRWYGPRGDRYFDCPYGPGTWGTIATSSTITVTWP